MQGALGQKDPFLDFLKMILTGGGKKKPTPKPQLAFFTFVKMYLTLINFLCGASPKKISVLGGGAN